MKEVKKEFCWFSITEYEKEEDIFCDDQSRLELLNRIFENRELLKKYLLHQNIIVQKQF